MTDREYQIGYDDPDLADRMRRAAIDAELDEVDRILVSAPRLRSLRLARAAGRLGGRLIGFATTAVAVAALVCVVHLVWLYVAWVWGWL